MNPNQKRAVAASTAANQITKSNAYGIILEPVITEKALGLSAYNQIVFKVANSANKPQISRAIELLFGKKVKAVNTLNQVGKNKRFKGRPGKRPGYKKAIVTLQQGESLDVTGSV